MDSARRQKEPNAKEREGTVCSGTEKEVDGKRSANEINDSHQHLHTIHRYAEAGNRCDI